MKIDGKSLIVYFDSTGLSDPEDSGRVVFDQIIHPYNKTAQQCADDLLTQAEGFENTVVILDPETFEVYASATKDSD